MPVPVAISLPCIMDMEQCELLRKKLMKTLRVDGPAHLIKADAVEYINRSGIQFLLAVIANSEQTRQDVKLIMPSTPVLAAIRDLSLTSFFEPFIVTEESDA